MFWGGWRWCPYLTSMPLPLKSLKWCIQGAHDKRRQMNPLYSVKLRIRLRLQLGVGLPASRLVHRCRHPVAAGGRHAGSELLGVAGAAAVLCSSLARVGRRCRKTALCLCWPRPASVSTQGALTCLPARPRGLSQQREPQTWLGLEPRAQGALYLGSEKVYLNVASA